MNKQKKLRIYPPSLNAVLGGLLGTAGSLAVSAFKGSGIAGMTCAIRLAESGVHVTVVSPFPSERSQSVMAAGGINAVLPPSAAGILILLSIVLTLIGGIIPSRKAARSDPVTALRSE